MATLASIVEYLLVRFFYTHVGVVTTDACEVDIRVVFG
jgi:hypothetical protein